MLEASGPPTSRNLILGVEDDSAGDRETAVLEQAKSIYGWVPNTIRVMARGSVAAELYLQASVLNGSGSLTQLERELLAITTASFNHCEYCLTAHSLAARGLGADAGAVTAARDADSSEPRTRAVLRFAAALLEARGRVTDSALDAAADAGLDERNLLDIATVIAENTLGNLINNLARTETDPVLARAARRLELR